MEKQASQQQILAVLARIAQQLNAAGVTWALGASMLLYFEGRTDTFHDIDLMLTDADAPRADALLRGMGEALPYENAANFRTRFFRKYLVDGVGVDLMAGMTIEQSGVWHDCSLDPAAVTRYAECGGQRIPLQPLAAWRRYYLLMGRPEKAALIGDDAGA